MGKQYYYEVERRFKGGVSTMLKTSSYKKAATFYFAHPQAKYIQKYTKHGITAGRLQPRTPNKIRFRGKTYKRVYVGPHKKGFAVSVAKSFRKKGMPTQIRKTKKGWFIFSKR